MNDRWSFGALLRELRLAAGLTQEDLAARSGLSARSISGLERGSTRRPFFRSAGLLADALDVPEPVRARLHDAARSARQAAPPPSPVPEAAGSQLQLAGASGRPRDAGEVLGDARWLTATCRGLASSRRLAGQPQRCFRPASCPG